MNRRAAAVWLLAVTVAVPSAALMPQVASATPQPTSTVIRGRGDGHGVGLPQDGALALGRAGESAAEILSTFYPGTALKTDRGAHMHVQVWQSTTGTSAEVSLPSGGRVDSPTGHIAVPAGGRVILDLAGSDWQARLASIPAGTAGRSLPRRLFDDPAPDPSASASPDSPSPGSPSPDSSSGDPDPEPSSSAGDGDAPSPEPSARATTGEPSSSAATSAASAPLPQPSDTPTSSDPPLPDASGGAGPSAPRLIVTGSALRIVPSGPEGVTSVLSTGRSYRGQIVTAPGQLINDVPLESYLRGLGEVLDPDWPKAGMQALVIAARTYALRDALGAVDPGDPQHVNICATDACQVYLGADGEYPQLTAAVKATQGTVIEYRGRLAETYYSASAGGETATPAEGFGVGPHCPT